MTRISKYSAYSLIGVSFIYLLSLSWNRWGNLIVDTFRDQWVFCKLSQGKVLYKDIFYLYGFLPPYLVSGIYRLFGINMVYSVWIGIFVTIATAALIYRISRIFLNRHFSVLAALNFLFIFAFGNYCYNGIFNFILPYSINSTFFILFILASLYSLLKFIRKKKRAYLFYWGIALYLALLCRPDIGCAVWLAFMFVGLIAAFQMHKSVLIIYSLIPLLAAVLSYTLFLYINNALLGFKESVIDIFLLGIQGRNEFEAAVSGLSLFLPNLLVMLRVFLFHFTGSTVLFLLSLVLGWFIEKGRFKRYFVLGYIISGVSSVAVFHYLLQKVIYLDHYRLIPIILIIGIIVYLVRVKEDFPRLTLFIVSLALLARIILNASPNQYGFFLLPSSIICYYIFFTDIFIRPFERWLPQFSGLKRYYLFGFYIISILLMLPFVRISHMLYESRNYKVTTQQGAIVSFNDTMTGAFWEAVSYLKENTEKSAKVVVMPEGEGINFFSQRDNPLRYTTFLPPQIKTIGEKKIIQELESQGIDYIVLVSLPAFDYGYPFFGIHYAKNLYNWILSKYDLVEQIGPYPFTSADFGIAIFQTRDARLPDGQGS